MNRSGLSGCVLLLVVIVIAGVIMTPVVTHWLDNQVDAVGEARAAEAWARAQAESARAEQERARAAEAWARAQAIQAEAPGRAAAVTAWLIGVGAVVLLIGAGAGLVAIWRASLIYPDEKGLYPMAPAALKIANLNEPGAQSLSIAPRAAMQILPAPMAPRPEIPEPIVIEAGRLRHVERLLLAGRPGGNDDDDNGND